MTIFIKSEAKDIIWSDEYRVDPNIIECHIF